MMTPPSPPAGATHVTLTDFGSGPDWGVVMQAAIDHCLTLGTVCVVDVPAGTYLVSSHVSQGSSLALDTRPAIWWIGAGRDTTIFRATISGFDMFSNHLSNCNFIGITWDVGTVNSNRHAWGSGSNYCGLWTSKVTGGTFFAARFTPASGTALAHETCASVIGYQYGNIMSDVILSGNVSGSNATADFDFQSGLIVENILHTGNRLDFYICADSIYRDSEFFPIAAGDPGYELTTGVDAATGEPIGPFTVENWITHGGGGRILPNNTTDSVRGTRDVTVNNMTMTDTSQGFSIGDTVNLIVANSTIGNINISTNYKATGTVDSSNTYKLPSSIPSACQVVFGGAPVALPPPPAPAPSPTPAPAPGPAPSPTPAPPPTTYQPPPLPGIVSTDPIDLSVTTLPGVFDSIPTTSSYLFGPPNTPVLPVELSVVSPATDPHYSAYAWAIAYSKSKGICVMMNWDGKAYVSTDGLNWTWYATPFAGPGDLGYINGPNGGYYNDYPNGVPYGGICYDETNEVFILQGWNGGYYNPFLPHSPSFSEISKTQCIATSPDGINWTLQTVPDALFIGPYYNNGLQTTNIAYSPDLQQVIASAPNTPNYGGFTCGISTDGGVTWTIIAPIDDPNWNSSQLISITWAHSLGQWAAVVENGFPYTMFLSSDGINWSGVGDGPPVAPTQGIGPYPIWIDDLGLFLAPVWWESANPMLTAAAGKSLAVSPTGVDGSWTYYPTPFDWYGPTYPSWGGIMAFAWSPELHIGVAISWYGFPNTVMTSTDGYDWFHQVSPWDDPKGSQGINSEPFTIEWCPGLGGVGYFVIAGSGSQYGNAGAWPVAMVSPDGINWTNIPNPSAPATLYPLRTSRWLPHPDTTFNPAVSRGIDPAPPPTSSFV